MHTNHHKNLPGERRIHLDPTACTRLPVPSNTNIIFFTDESSSQRDTPTVSCASLCVSRCADGFHMEHQTGATVFRASSLGKLRTLADTVIATPSPTTKQTRNILVLLDARGDIHLIKCLAELALHKSLESGLTTQALGLWMAFRGMRPQDALHIVKQESHSYTYGNGRADTHAKHRNTNHTPELQHVQVDTTDHSHLQHLPRIPSLTHLLHWVPQDTPYTDRDKHYDYPTPIQQLATTRGHQANTKLLRRLKDSVCTLLA